MEYRFRLPPFADSPLARLDGRWRLAALLVLTVAVTLVRQPVGAVLAVVVSVVVAGLARVPIDWLAMRLAAVALVGICFAVPLVLFGRPDEAVVVAFKAVALAVLAGVLVVSAPLERTARAAWHLGVPGVVIQVALLAYRYVFLLGDELERLRVALRVRGFRNRPNRHSYYTVAAATGTLLARGADRADRVAAAMRCRGFDGTFRSLDDDRTRWEDGLTLVIALVVAGALLGADRYIETTLCDSERERKSPSLSVRSSEASHADFHRRRPRISRGFVARLSACSDDVVAASRELARHVSSPRA